MKIENEPLSGHSPLLSKHDSPQSRFIKRNIDINQQMVIKNRKEFFTKLQNIEKNLIPLSSEINVQDDFLNTLELERTMIVEYLSHDTDNKIKNSEKTESEIPGPLVCYKDDQYSVKDICVYEEVLVKDKITFGNENDMKDRFENAFDGNENSVTRKESDSDEFLSPDGSLQSSENDDENDSQEIKFSSEKNTSSEEYCSPINKKMVDGSRGEDLNSASLLPDFSSQKTLMSFLLSSDYNGNDFDKHAKKDPCSEPMYGIPTIGLSYNSKMNNTTASELSSCKILSYNDEAQEGQDESISSGRITCSGPMLIYSGSVSIRSESSSTRSFAFPILQPEWHASPVKMAKPDRRKYRKPKGWKQALTCCRF